MLKRSFDVIISAVALVLLAPLIGVVALLVWLNLGYPIFFRQWRPGLYGKPFKLIKFRTMREAADLEGKSLRDEARLGAFGKALRASSLDELPELLNVLKGDMSLVGPRPLLMSYLARYSSAQARRHEVRPGITGWAQVNGRNALSWEDKFRYDVWYVDNRNFLLDLQIIALTARDVVMRRGISAQGHVSMPEFTGTQHSVREDSEFNIPIVR